MSKNRLLSAIRIKPIEIIHAPGPTRLATVGHFGGFARARPVAESSASSTGHAHPVLRQLVRFSVFWPCLPKELCRIFGWAWAVCSFLGVQPNIALNLDAAFTSSFSLDLCVILVPSLRAVSAAPG